jgi:AcrR family transcriptional regulator
VKGSMEIQDRILAEAQSLFMRYGIKSVTMDDISSHLAVSKKTIYQHYKDKDSLVSAIAERHMEEEKRQLDIIFDQGFDALEELFKITQFIRHMISMMNPAVMYDLKKYHPKAWSLFQEHKECCIYGNIKQNLDRGVSEGYYRQDLDTDIMAKMRMFQTEFGFDIDRFPPTEYDMPSVQMQIFEHFIRGLLTEKGIAHYKELQEQENN